MKVNKPKAHKQASHCVKWIPDVFFLNYIVTTTARSTYSNTLYGYSSYGKIFLILTFKFLSSHPGPGELETLSESILRWELQQTDSALTYLM